MSIDDSWLEARYLESAKIVETKDLAAESAEAMVKAAMRGKTHTFFAPHWAGEDRYLFKAGNSFRVRVVIIDVSTEVVQKRARKMRDSPIAGSNSEIVGDIIDILNVRTEWEKGGARELRYVVLECGIFVWMQIPLTARMAVGETLRVRGRLDLVRK